MANYRKLWSEHYGLIPIDEEGRPYHIHHIDGNRSNNDISNLECLSARDHYERHLFQEDYGAAYKLAQLLRLDPKLQKELKSEHGKTRIGPLNNFFGRTHSSETKSQIAEALRKRHPSSESNEKRRLTQTGQKRSAYKSFLCPHCLHEKIQRTHVPQCKGKWFVL